MKYQIAQFNPGPENWHYHRKDFKIVQFDSLEDAEREAIELSQHLGNGLEVVVMTIHACFKTEKEYPPVEPISRTRRVFVNGEHEPETVLIK